MQAEGVSKHDRRCAAHVAWRGVWVTIVDMENYRCAAHVAWRGVWVTIVDMEKQ